METNKKPHKHAAVIKAWADGARVEYREQPGRHGWYKVSTPSWYDDYEYRVVNKHQALIDAHAAGAEIEYKDWQGFWKEASTPTWAEDREYRIKPVDPYAEMKAAQAAGKTIQARYKSDMVPNKNQWADVWSPDFNSGATLDYRIKPDPVYPKSNIDIDILQDIWRINSDTYEVSFQKIADEAIKHFIASGDMQKYINDNK